MQQLSGKAISPGYAQGTAFVYSRSRMEDVPRYEITSADVAGEQCRFDEALQRSFQDLKQVEHRVLDELGEAHSAIFAAHLGLLTDHQFVARIKDRIQRDLINVEQAIEVEVADLCAMLAAVENEYIRERAQDIRDVGERLLRQLAAQDAGHYVELPPQSVIVARELFPSETLDLDRKHVVGIVTEAGGENSHAAILARALGIPAVTGITAATSRIPGGAEVLVDGEKGIVSIKPNAEVMADFTVLKSHYDDDTSAAVAAECLDCVTRDGTRISLLANINRPHESALANAHHLDGIGLFRTEFMFLDSTEPPGFDRQLNAYRQVIESVADRPVVIRTLDLGGDKLPAFLESHYETNPNLGLRGLRFSLAEQTLFRTQVRAIVTAAQGHKGVRLLLPMVLGPDDLTDASEQIRNLVSQLGVTTPTEIGAMVETPAALFALEEIFQIADFVCIGTNDLTQYMLAADRSASELADDYSVLHPSVLRAIARVAEAGRRAGRDVSVCGEAASYPRTACLLVGLGLRQLSMSPLRAARVRYLLRETDVSQLEQLAAKALNSSSVDEVRHLLENLPSHSERSKPAADAR